MDKENNNEELINPSFAKRGYIQVYTGDGKGKTTASLGLTLRALGHGWKVLIVMFTKGGNKYGELLSFKGLGDEIAQRLDIVQAGLDRIVYANNMSEKDQAQIKKGWDYVKKSAEDGTYQLIIMDEANIAIDLELIELEDMKNFLKNKPQDLEVVLTGRNAHDDIKEIAHLVSEIKPIKHYWDIGVEARKGIEF